MSGHIYTVEFRICSEALDPLAVTEELGLTPSSIRTPGVLRSDGRVLDGEWVFNGVSPGEARKIEWDSLENGLTFVMDKLWSRREAIARYQSRARVIWWCGNFQTGFDGGPLLSASLLSKLGDFGVALFIDNYFSGPTANDS